MNRNSFEFNPHHNKILLIKLQGYIIDVWVFWVELGQLRVAYQGKLGRDNIMCHGVHVNGSASVAKINTTAALSVV